MGNCITLHTTDLSDLGEALADEGFEHQKQFLSKGGDRPALLWVAMFRAKHWQGAKTAEDQEHVLPFASIQEAIENLKAAEPILSRHFQANGGVSTLVSDVITKLSGQRHKNLYIWSLGCDWTHERDFPMVQAFNAFLEGGPAIPGPDLADYFELTMKKGLMRSRAFVRPTEVFSSSSFEEEDHWNTTAMTGVSDIGEDLDAYGW